MNILIQITFLIFNKYPKVQFQSENKFTESRFQDCTPCLSPLNILDLFGWVLGIWAEDQGIGECEGTRLEIAYQTQSYRSKKSSNQLFPSIIENLWHEMGDNSNLLCIQ